jgi:hypothetical protein
MGKIDAASRAVTRAHRDILRAKNEASKWAALRRQSADSVALLQREYNMLTTLKAQADAPCTYYNYRYSPTQNGVVDPLLTFGALGWAYYDPTAFKYHIMYDSNCDYVYQKQRVCSSEEIVVPGTTEPPPNEGVNRECQCRGPRTVDGQGVCKCESNKIWIDATSECVCEANRVWDTVTKTCVCANGQIADPATGACRCPSA